MDSTRHHNDGLDAQTRQKIIGLLKVLFPTAKIILYGSRARGDFHDRSDIDLALDDGPHKARLELGEARTVLEGLHIPYRIDLVDLNHVNEHMQNIIRKEGVLWND
jgi:predicted nucleotidyltransferase